MSKKTNTPIRVLQVVTVMNRAGLETMLMNYYRAIDRTKVQFDFLVHRAERGDYDDEIEKLGGKIYRFSPMTIRSMFGYKKKIKNFLLEHPEHRVVHSHIDALSALPLSGAKDAGVPTRIAHSHTNSFDKNAKLIVRHCMKPFIRLYATDFMGCSEAAIRFMFGKKVKEYSVINNAIDVVKFAHNPSIRQKVRTDLALSEKFVVGHVGRFSYPKNHEFLIDIFKEVHTQKPDSILLLVGTGENEQKIKDKVAQLGLQNDVLFLGLRTDIPDLMQAMDIFVMPSRYEGIPVVAIEAQASGLVCVFSSAVNNSLDVTGKCQFINLRQHPKEWAGNILRVVEESERADIAEKIVDAKYSIKEAAANLLAIYQEGGC